RAIIFTSKNQEDHELNLTYEQVVLYQYLLSKVTDREDVPLIYDRKKKQVDLIPGTIYQNDRKLALLLQNTGYNHMEIPCPSSLKKENNGTKSFFIIDRKKHCLKTISFESSPSLSLSQKN